ncbi:1,4-dihydroxy-2-naphthoate octaprenyltransferase [Campylobacter blaseri]|uniref:1,4-dihydroxy-2-naphthoate polyprenyltransferase n=1 Tax=Campylobacter blaseri TaxID=2042961 RepID=A0A2P8R0A3_9BACT|nr:1,4-dihydroxy-2-naphthoate polyprenyltransferase [Campylobacter blaseri]PSM51927.1 1,4-dihydroxy-2-naphthoate polyprenyltransferase [Campylobacter blaseri]PSM53711.1 1,4-dihydroxy-2-naphthoate polyprenyltransferase [Campylobacter blaseri]QKF85735.1 1,4-dihydroxy-2-naphthoate octaprenyltransferase [Campylobacter blaseri]
MNLKIFLELIEFKAKAASLFPFLLGVCISIYHFNSFDLNIAIILYLAMFLFNCFVDIWDNYMDYKNAIDEEHYKVKTNVIGRENLNIKQLEIIMAISFLVSFSLGIFLVSKTGIELLFLGLISFIVGVWYSYGKRPISSTPFGEIASGLTMGFLIPLITVFTLNPERHVFEISNLWIVFLSSFINIIFISNLLFANNICDMDEDRKNGRVTLPHILGFKNSILLFKFAYIFGFLSVILAVFTKVYPISLLLVFICIPLVVKNTIRLEKTPIKLKSFKYIITNLGVMSFLQVLSFGVYLMFFF